MPVVKEQDQEEGKPAVPESPGPIIDLDDYVEKDWIDLGGDESEEEEMKPVLVSSEVRQRRIRFLPLFTSDSEGQVSHCCMRIDSI